MGTVHTLSTIYAAECLEQATVLLAEWHRRQTNTATRRSYRAAGQQAIAAIDAAVRELNELRSALVGELLADDRDRATRTDVLLAASRATRAGWVLPVVARQTPAAPVAEHRPWCWSPEHCEGDCLAKPADVPATAGAWSPTSLGARYPSVSVNVQLAESDRRPQVALVIHGGQGPEEAVIVWAALTAREARRVAGALVEHAEMSGR